MTRKKKRNEPCYYDENSGSEFDLESINCCQLNVHKKRIRKLRAKYHNHPAYEGHLQKRSCTDVICLLVFVVFVAAWVALGIFAFVKGSPEKIFAPTDSNNARCGYDESVKDKPHLFFFDLSQCALRPDLFHCATPQICVKDCPKEDFYAAYYTARPDMSVDFVRNKLYCKDDVNVSELGSLQDIKNAVKDNLCAPWYLASQSVYGRCIYDPFALEADSPDLNGTDWNVPEKKSAVHPVLTLLLIVVMAKKDIHELGDILNNAENITIHITDDTGHSLDATISGVTGADIHAASDIAQALASVKEFGHAVVRDLVNTWRWILVCIAVAMVASFVYIVLMRWLAGIMTWLSILACVGLLAYCSYASWEKYAQLRDYTDTPKSSKSSNPILNAVEDQVNSYLRMKETWLAFFIISTSILAIILIILLFLRNRIRLAIALINEGSKAVSHSMFTLMFPIFPWVAQIGVICYSVAICVFLFASGIPVYRVSGLRYDDDCSCSNDYTDGSLCEPEEFVKYCHNKAGLNCSISSCIFEKHETETYSIYLQLYNLFMFLWGLFFVSGLDQMILASTFATYYWTFNKDNLPFFLLAKGAWRVFRYHLGTVAFGSLLLAICNWIRVMIEVAYKYVNNHDNAFVKALKCCLSCFFWCLNQFLKFLNKNAYIMCAIHGKNFCVSAKDAFSLLVRNILRVFVLDKVTDFLFFLSKLMITAGMGAWSFYLFSEPLPNMEDLTTDNRYQAQYYFVPIFFVCTGTFFIASIFFGVYSMAVNTLFLCFLQDCEKNDGSEEKPYFMSKSLMRILGRKNKKNKIKKSKD